MIKPIARLIVRGQGDGPVDLILGTCFRQQTFFRTGRVYEVNDILGGIGIRDAGPSVVKDTVIGSPIQVGWASDANHILSAGKHIFLTMSEYEEILRSGL